MSPVLAGGFFTTSTTWEASRYTLLYINQIKNKDLLYNTGNCIQNLSIIYSRKSLKKNTYIWIFTYIHIIYLDHFLYQKLAQYCK